MTTGGHPLFCSMRASQVAVRSSPTRLEKATRDRPSVAAEARRAGMGGRRSGLLPVIFLPCRHKCARGTALALLAAPIHSGANEMKISSATGATALFFSALLGAAACGPDKDKSPGEKASDAIEEAQISRQMYYQLEERALHAMLRALSPGATSEETASAGAVKRAQELEAKVGRLEQEKRRSERLLLLTRKLVGKRMKTAAGRPRRSAKATSAGKLPSVTSKKNRSPVIVAFSVGAEVPSSTRCNWKLRRSSALAVSGERPRYLAKRRTARI